jgi:hypothetical protein
LARAYAYALRSSIKASIDGVELVDLSNDDTDDDAYLVVTQAALELIKSIDPRRYAVILREVKYIVNGGLNSLAEYHRTNRNVEIDFGKFHVYVDAPDYEQRLARYASTIVHEAIHGRIESFGILYTRETRVRIEKICVAQQHLFLSRWATGREDVPELVPKFDERNWHRSWHSNPVAEFRGLRRRYKAAPGSYRERMARNNAEKTQNPD